MNKPPISFRLTDSEWEVLEKEQKPEESINQTAARLLREKLGILTVDNEYALKPTTLANWITEVVNSKLENVQFALETMIADKFDELDQH